MGFLDAVKSKMNDFKRTKRIKKQIWEDQSIDERDVNFFEANQKMTPKEYYTIKYNQKNYCFKTTVTIAKVDLDDNLNQFRVGSKIGNYEDVADLFFTFDEGKRTEAVSDQQVEVQKGGFGIGRAAVGAALLGPVGLLFGATKKDKVVVKNGKKYIEIPTFCHIKLTITMNDGSSLVVNYPDCDQDKSENIASQVNQLMEKLTERKDWAVPYRQFEDEPQYDLFDIEVIPAPHLEY